MLEIVAIYVWIGLMILVISAGIKHDSFSTETKIFIIFGWPIFIMITAILMGGGRRGR